MRSTIEIAKESGFKENYSGTLYNLKALESFRKACEADYKIRCEQVATIQTNGDSLYAFVRPSYELELGTQLFTLPNDGE